MMLLILFSNTFDRSLSLILRLGDGVVVLLRIISDAPYFSSDSIEFSVVLSPLDAPAILLCSFNLSSTERIVRNVMLCYVMLCYVMLCHVMSCYVMSCYVM